MVTGRKLGDNRGEDSERVGVSPPDAPLTFAPKEDALADPKNSTGKSPAFQFYPDTFLSDANVILMSMAERGVYITLICVCWQQGRIPTDTATLAKLCNLSHAAFTKLWPAVQRCFIVTSKGDALAHPRLDRERRKQAEYKREKSDAGKAGANKRWQSHGNAIAQPSNPNGTAMVLPMAKNGSLSLSSSLSSSLDSSPQERVRAAEPKPTNGNASHFAQQPSDFSTDENRRAGDFVERYGDLHERHRKGARYIGKPNLDYLEALQLVRVWDDERLDKLAHAFLVTNDEWVSSGSRTMARFRSRASWCDDELRKVGL